MDHFDIAVTIKPDDKQTLQEKYDEVKDRVQDVEFKTQDFERKDIKELKNMNFDGRVKNILTINRPLEKKGSKIDDQCVKNVRDLISKMHLVDVDITYILKKEDFLTLENIKQIIDIASKNDKKVIVSWHNYESPSNKKMLEYVERWMCGFKDGFEPDIYKLITTAHKVEDCNIILDFLKYMVDKKKKAICWSMGKYGRISRVLSPVLGGYLTFASPEKGKESAKGQSTLDEMIKLKNDIGDLTLLDSLSRESLRKADEYLEHLLKN